MVRSFDRSCVRPIICSLSTAIPLAHALPSRGRDLHIVEKRGRFDVTTVYRVASLLRRHQIDVLHAFLFDAEIVARLAAPLAGVRAVVSSERNADYTRSRLHKVALGLTRPLFDVMVANSNAGKEFNIRTQGLDPSRIEVVHNGVDTERFYSDREAGVAFRRRLGIPLDVPVVGMIGSYKRQKGHDNFLNMANLVRQSVPTARFLVIGGPVGDPEESRRYREEVRFLCTTLNLDDCCAFLDNQEDTRSAYNACDATALLSRREGTPNVVLESMACGVPVVVSDISDNAFIVKEGQTGFVVPVDDAARAAARVSKLLEQTELRDRLGAAGSVWVRENFSLERAARKLERIYRRCLTKTGTA